MTGHVDDAGRALVRLSVKHPVTQVGMEIEAWIDTAFVGKLLLPLAQVQRLDLPSAGEVIASLADGSQSRLTSHQCIVTWLGKDHRVECQRSPVGLALLGVGLLEDCLLTINYPTRTVTVKETDSPFAAR